MNDEDIARFWSKVDRRGPDECWPYRCVPNKSGYGYDRFSGKDWRVHRLMYVLTYGPIPAGVIIDHLCHTTACKVPARECPHRLCVNPAHLVRSTQRANILRGNGVAARHAALTECPRCGSPFTIGKRQRYCGTCKANNERDRRHQRAKA